jgi:hypothetical protein
VVGAGNLWLDACRCWWSWQLEQMSQLLTWQAMQVLWAASWSLASQVTMSPVRLVCSFAGVKEGGLTTRHVITGSAYKCTAQQGQRRSAWT